MSFEKDLSYERAKAEASRVLTPQDPLCVEVLASTGFVSVYSFDDKSSQWSRADIAGFLFLIRRSDPQARFRLIILNQRNQSDLMDDLDASWEISHEPNYIFYRRLDRNTGVQKTRGLWFYEDEERIRIWRTLVALIEQIKAPPTLLTDDMVTNLLRRLIHASSR